MTLKGLFTESLGVKPRKNGFYSVHPPTYPPTGGSSWFSANDALTLSAAHRLIQSLSEQTQSRSELDECRDVMAALERMVADV